MTYLQKLLELPKNKKIALVGMGAENKQFLDWLLSVVKLEPTRIILADEKEQDSDYNQDFQSFSGASYLDCLNLPQVEYVFKAPGIWSLKEEFANFRNRKGREKVLSSLVFFVEKYREQIIGITGTKGKSTTSSLINCVLGQNGIPPTPLKGGVLDEQLSPFSPSANWHPFPLFPHYCGNTTGISPYKFWTELSQTINPKEFFVIELSSFQLQDLGYSQISPKYAVITNYFVDHLDQHGSKEEYWQSKDHLFKWQKSEDLVIANQQVLEHSQNLQIQANKLIITQKEADFIQENIEHNLIGEHNLLNLTEAIFAVATIFCKGQNLTQIQDFIFQNKQHFSEIIKSFKPLAHRLELVRTVSLPI